MVIQEITPHYCKRCACELDIKPKPSMMEIVTGAAAFFGKKSADILGPKRQHYYVIPRYFAMYFMIENNYGVTEIGRLFERDHASIIHARKTIKNMFETNPIDTAHYLSFKNTFI